MTMETNQATILTLLINPQVIDSKDPERTRDQKAYKSHCRKLFLHYD